MSATVWGTLTAIFSICAAILGLGRQVYVQWKKKQCGITFMLAVFPFAVFVCRLGYAFTIKANYLIVPDILGAVFSATILVQYFLYRNNQPLSSRPKS
jgi:hypothetical protein